MTGFGAATAQNDEAIVRVDIRSVNHRHLDLRLHLPPGLPPLPGLSKLVSSYLSRGRVDLRLEIERQAAADQAGVRVDYERAKAVCAATDGLLAQLGRSERTPVALILQAPGVVVYDDGPAVPDALDSLAEEAATAALEQLCAMRTVEGDHLTATIRGHLKVIRELAAEIAERSPQVMKHRLERLKERVQEYLQSEIDDQRIAHEVAILADRLDVTEEIERLDSHLEQAEQLLAGGKPAGRRLDFIVQELNREANTIGSKGQDSTVVHRVVDLKAEIERLREQAQNLE